MFKKRKKIIVGVLGLMMALGLAACGKSSQPADTGKVQVVASLDFYGEMAKAVGGNKVEVQSIIHSASVDPHDYEPSSADAKDYHKASLIISNGGDYDNWSTNYAKQNEDAKSIVAAKLTGWKTGGNEHLWYRPDTPKKMTNAIAAKLSELRPKDKGYFKKNAASYLTKLAPLRKLQSEAQKQLAGKTYMATEPVYDNTLLTLGAKQVNAGFARAVDDGNDPTVAQMKLWRASVKDKKVAFIINNPQNSGKMVKQAIAYAKANGVPVINATETMPDGKDYLSWQTGELQQVLDALK
ncbi:zinc ABC transporter substrate-binding protein [Lacticaseibacillus pabuli]|uniref:Zinc ABC transporter substrate-binding protein n=1 Tax=Lacticaseibacillus pabuli TaxID=3025672 RepID=A0ABY7WTD0_9LACO|nr:zinc ABC transporter substrate-binding protein [Lacticaseibacillus sp. KACC 23028]WDF83006.1 zinc ABC transporter substrate-binding protein [Lacticaseibacillus sp. KACC 23028]